MRDYAYRQEENFRFFDLRVRGFLSSVSIVRNERLRQNGRNGTPVQIPRRKRILNKTLPGLTLALLSLSATAVYAADPNLGRNLAATCANCHGTDGNSVGGMEVLAGMPKGKMLNSLKAFRNGEKPATIMHQIAKGYT